MVPSVVMPWERGCSWPKPAGRGQEGGRGWVP